MKLHLALIALFISQTIFSQLKVVSICPNSNTVFSSGGVSSSNNYRWEVDVNDGSGYHNISNSTVYSGAVSNTLTITNAQSSMFGYKYRCRMIDPQDTVTGITYVLKFSVTWVGGTSVLWQNVNNWNCGVVPDANTEVRIPTGASFYPQLNFNTSVKKIVVDSAGSLTVAPNVQLSITGTDPGIIISQNVHKVDSASLVLTSDSAMLSQGVYEFTSPNVFPNFKVNDIIAGDTKKGYLRKVTNVTKQAGKRILQTVQAGMEDVFEEGKFNLNVSSDNLVSIPTNSPASPGSVTESGFSVDLANTVLFQAGPLMMKISSGSVKFDPNWFFDFEYKDSKVKTFEMSCKNASLSTDFVVEVSATQAITEQETDTIKTWDKTFTKWIPIFGVPIPVCVTMRLDLICESSANITASVNRKVNFQNKTTMNLGVKYANSQWQPIYNLNTKKSIEPTNIAGHVKADVQVSIEPRLSFKLYNAAGPYASVALQTLISGQISAPALDWNLKVAAWLQTKVGADVVILGKSLADYNKSWNSDSLQYNTPDTLKRVSGNGQVGEPHVALLNPLKVKVVDSDGKAVSGVPVYFDVTNGNGTVLPASILSDGSGVAETNWTLGDFQDSAQKVTAKAKKGDGSNISGSPVQFTASNRLDTPAILVSHGRWSAFEGTDSYGNVYGNLAPFYYSGTCSGVLGGHYREDSLIYTFNTGGTGSVKWQYYEDDYNIINYTTCQTGPQTFSSDSYSVQITWQYIPSLHAVRVTYSADIQEFDGGDVVDFVFSSFAGNLMQLAGTGPLASGWNYKFR